MTGVMALLDLVLPEGSPNRGAALQLIEACGRHRPRSVAGGLVGWVRACVCGGGGGREQARPLGWAVLSCLALRGPVCQGCGKSLPHRGHRPRPPNTRTGAAERGVCGSCDAVLRTGLCNNRAVDHAGRRGAVAGRSRCGSRVCGFARSRCPSLTFSVTHAHVPASSVLHSLRPCPAKLRLARSIAAGTLLGVWLCCIAAVGFASCAAAGCAAAGAFGSQLAWQYATALLSGVALRTR